MVLDLLKNAKPEDVEMNVIGCLAQIITQPYAVFHKNFIETNATMISDAIKQRLI
jgi:hypothetical protein